VRVTLSASPSLSKVVVRLRDRRGRQLGRSKAITVGRRTKATIKLKRRLRTGRYTLTASGKTTDGASKARARRAVSVRR
jgi:hypothetical protein